MRDSDREAIARATVSVTAALGSAIDANHDKNDLAALISFGGAVAPDMVPHLAAMGKRRLARLPASCWRRWQGSHRHQPRRSIEPERVRQVLRRRFVVAQS